MVLMNWEAAYHLANPADKQQESKVSAEFRNLYPADTQKPTSYMKSRLWPTVNRDRAIW